MSGYASFHPTFPEQLSGIAAQVREQFSRSSTAWIDVQLPADVPEPGVEASAAEAGAPHRVPGQRALLETWWAQLDQVTRRRLLRLTPEDFLPADVALDLQMVGVRVIAVGTVAVEDGYDALYEQPVDVVDLLADARAGCPG